METLGERLKAARVAAKYTSAAKAAEALGISPSTYRAHENGQNDYDVEDAKKYARKFNVSVSYLLEGVEMKKAIVSSYDPDFDKKAYSRENWSPSTPRAIPEIDVKLGAGLGSIGEIISIEHGGERIAGHRVIAEWVMPDDFVTQELRSSRKSTVVMEVVGDSMSPTYQPGDRVIVDLSQTDHVSDTVYAISDGVSEPQIKRLQRVPFSDPARVKIISDNPALETFEVDLERVQIIGRICGHVARR